MDEDKLIFQGTGTQHPERLQRLPEAPPWRTFKNQYNRQQKGKTYQATPEEVTRVNAALYLRRPLLITGTPGTGKSSLAYAVAYELDLDPVLVWPITSRSTLSDGLYRYDAMGRLQEIAQKQKETQVTEQMASIDIGRFIHLGPMGTALLKSQSKRPSVVLIDEIDKSDIDFPNDLLHLFEEGEFEIQELARLSKAERPNTETIEVFAHGGQEKLSVPANGLVRCEAFPLVMMTSNGEKEFPPAFLRRCLRLNIKSPDPERIKRIVNAHFNMEENNNQVQQLINDFLTIRDTEQKAITTDQLLNAVYLLMEGIELDKEYELSKAIFEALSDLPAS